MSLSNQAPARKSRGRQKVKMEKMANESNLQVTFSKRRAGLFKKASELCVLCGVEALIVVFSPAKKAFSYGHPDVEGLANKFLNGDTPNPPSPDDSFKQMIVEATRNSNIRSRNLELTQVNSKLAMEKRKAQELNMLKKQGQTGGWIAPPIERFNLEQLNFFKKTIMNYSKHFEEDVAKFILHNPNPATSLNTTIQSYATRGMKDTSNVGSSIFIPSNNPSFPRVVSDVETCFNTRLNETGRISNMGEFPFKRHWTNNRVSFFGDTGVDATSETSVTKKICKPVLAQDEFNIWASSFGDTRVHATSGTSVANKFTAQDPIELVPYKPMELVPSGLLTPSYGPNAFNGVADPYCAMSSDPGDAMFYRFSGSGMYTGFNNGT